MQLLDYEDMPRYLRPAWSYDIGWAGLPEFFEKYRVNIDPDFQRAHVWTNDQRSRYVEHLFKGGKTAREIYINAPNWNGGPGHEDSPNYMGDVVLVDGKQRFTALSMFLNDELAVFGHKISQMTLRGKPLETTALLTNRFSLKVFVNDLETRSEVLQWYLDINSGGTQHTEDEIQKVRDLLSLEDNA